MWRGLTARTVVASGLLALVVGSAFAVLLTSVTQLRADDRRALRAQEVLVTANHLERLVVDMETGQRGYLLTGREELLQPWEAAGASFGDEARTLEQLVADNPEQQARAERIAAEGDAYLRDYSVPLVAQARRDRSAVRTLPEVEEGRRRVDVLRAEFDQFLATERRLAEARQDGSEAAANRAVFAAVAGLAGSVLFVVVFAGYLHRVIVAPVRQVAATAGRLAAGDLGSRLPERGVGEVGVLQRSFNAMAGSLEQGRDALAASRARVVAAGDQARRRIERDLHDGTQQRLVSLILALRAAEAAVPPGSPELRKQLSRAVDGLSDALEELRELSRGIHPAILSEGGLRPALRALARRSAVPVDLAVDVPARLPEQVEVGAYYVVSEALANAAKHADASVVEVEARLAAGRLHLSVRDDGTGGADPGRGSGLVGLADRVHALGGTLSVTSPVGSGTTLVVDLPATER
ncbi:CHASE3 domain-containing protein [Micromonospora sp. KC213]|uniref:CHASE3 domain-containing protein n=1 Tax=Micromonospora sp. KC213 TaxID=2530378 RepID=UPI001050FC57|nr:CHASE3 domain-containing protein [Micromonospora sp. KC213]TDC42176.1 HAMP domain-containing protein [Micromonospora sp. KC213]